MIKFDFESYSNIKKTQLNKYNKKLSKLDTYYKKYHQYMGWYDVNKINSEELIEDIIKTSKKIKKNCDIFLSVGIGGSYMGASSIIEALNPYFNDSKPSIYFVGNSLSSEYFIKIKELIKENDVIVNFISKSGDTFEITLMYDLIMELMHKKYDQEELKDRVIITTGIKDSFLREEAIKNEFKIYEVPSDIGGRFSVLSVVGLLPIAVSGIDIKELLEGAKAMNSLSECKKYAVIKKLMHHKDYYVEAFVVYEPKLYLFTEWLKQLYAESLGKEEQGILPIGVVNTRDLHSLGQFMQDGSRIIFETIINVLEAKEDLYIEKYHKTLNEINNIASIATSKAHYKDHVLNNVINIDQINPYNMGYLLQFFMVSCTISAYLDDVNAFNQDGVEEYKKTMQEMLNNVKEK